MDNCEALIKVLLEAVKGTMETGELTAGNIGDTNTIPVGVSGRHLHLSQADLNKIFGEGYEPVKMKDLSQPGQFACKETITIVGPKGAIEKVRVLGPVRSKTQIEVLTGDCFKLGLPAEARLSGDLTGTPGITIVGPKGSVQTSEGLIVAQRHIHMTLEEAKQFGVKDGEVVSIKVEGPRGGIYSNVAVRANKTSSLECHIDTEEANAMSLSSSSTIKIVS